MKRSIHIKGKVYKYTVGKSFVKITGPNGETMLTDLSTISGVSWRDIEKAWGRVAITPSMVKNYIEKSQNLLKKS